MCLATPSGRLESNYVQLGTRKNIAETLLPLVTLLRFQGFHLLLEGEEEDGGGRVNNNNKNKKKTQMALWN